MSVVSTVTAGFMPTTNFTGQHAYGPHLARNLTWNKSMIVAKSLSDTQQISNTAIKELVRERINDLGEATSMAWVALRISENACRIVSANLVTECIRLPATASVEGIASLPSAI
jgi:hypothetical protein